MTSITRAIGEYVTAVADADGPAWPMATQPRPDHATRGKARLDSVLGRNFSFDQLADMLDVGPAPRRFDRASFA